VHFPHDNLSLLSKAMHTVGCLIFLCGCQEALDEQHVAGPIEVNALAGSFRR
jgi:hypothetical protein